MRSLVPGLLALSATVAPAADIPAFPGAQGYGAATVHGRGGRVIAVTNLDDSGPGSLRAALEASGPRIVVFRVGGLIRFRSRMYIREPYLYVAGQTAPGDGICVADCQLSVNTHDVVIRFVRSRAGDTQSWNPSFDNIDAMEIANEGAPPHRIVIDHCSFSWGVDETASCWYPCHDITWQWNIISEGLHRSRHSKGPHGKGMLIGEGAQRIAIHHNLFAHNHDRNPMLKGKTAVEVANNTVYNWGGGRDDPQLDYTCAYLGLVDVASDESSRLDFLGNTMKAGPDSYAFAWGIRLNRNMPAASRVFLRDNRGPGRSDASGDEWRIMRPGDGGYRSDTPTMSGSGVAMQAVDVASARVLDRAGAILPRRNVVDARVVADVRAGTGRVIDSQAEVGGWPAYASGDAPADADGDGMADAWELARGLSPSTPDDGRADRDGDGSTNVEEYLESLVPRDAYGETALAITTPPSARTVAVGASAGFSVVASGSGTLSYRWQRDGADIVGATAASYTTPPCVPGDDGRVFRVIVGDASGSTVSADATLTVVAGTGGGTPDVPAPPAGPGAGSGNGQSGGGGGGGCGLGGGMAVLIAALTAALRRQRRD